MPINYDAAPQNSPIDYVVFDLGGVVFAWTEAMPALRSRIGAAPEVTDETFSAAYYAPRFEYDRDSDSRRYWSSVAAACGAPRPTTDDCVDLDMLDVIGWSHTMPGTIALINEIAATGTGLAILSNAPATMGRHVRAQEWARPFRHILISGEFGLVKPDPAIYHRLLAELGSPASGTVFLDDRADNIAGAIDCGIKGIHFTDSASARRELLASGVHLG